MGRSRRLPRATSATAMTMRRTRRSTDVRALRPGHPASAELAVQRAAIDAEDARRARDVAAALVEHALDVAALDLGERELAGRGAGEQIAGGIGLGARR